MLTAVHVSCESCDALEGGALGPDLQLLRWLPSGAGILGPL